MEFKDKIFILLELKFADSVLKYGQKTALERGCDAWTDAGKTAVILIARYNNRGTEEIDVAPLPVSEFRIDKKWHKPKIEITVRQAIDQILTWHRRK